MKKRVTGEQILRFLRGAETGMPVKELRREHDFFSETSYYLWRGKFDGMNVPRRRASG